VRAFPPQRPLRDGVVVLREWREDDVPAIAAACSDAETARWLDQIPQPYTERDARDYLASTRRGWREGTIASFAIADAETGEAFGSISIHWVDHEHAVGEVGYWVGPRARGRGIATRAVRLVSRWGIEECHLRRLQLRADVENLASQRVAEKAGFTREGVLRSIRYSERQRGRVDFVVFSILPGELD
jgi:RimJ/RimL family protein N-acetyltransferase